MDGPNAAAPAVNTNGTAFADLYNAADTTLQSADVINAGGGIDTLSMRAATVEGGTVLPVLTSVEIVEVSNVSGAQYTLNVVSATGMTTATVKDTTLPASVVEFENLATTVAGRLDNGDVQAEFNYSGAAARTGTADAVALQIANGSGTAGTASVVRYTNGAGAVDETFENVNITTSGAASNVNFGNGNASFRVINVGGDAAIGTAAIAGGVQNYALSLNFAETAATAMRTVSASGMTGTGGVNINLTGSTQTTVAFTGSAQNDRVVIDGTIANAANTFSLNAGSGGANDILAMDDITDFAAAGSLVARQTVNSATGFETLEATAAVVTTLDANQFTTINSFVFSGTQTGGNAVTNLRTGDSVAYTVDSTRAGDVVTLSGAVAGQSATVTLTGGVDLTATGAGNALTVNSGLASVAIVSSNVQGLATAAAVNTIRAASEVEAIDNVSASTFTASGAAGLTVGAVAGLAAPLGFTTNVSFDATALTGVLRIAGSLTADVIKGGTAADIIYGLSGNDELTGNGGADQFRFLTDADGTDVIRDFTVGTDKVGIVDAVINFAGTAGTAAGAAIASTDYEASRNDITNIVVGDTLKVIELQTGLTTAQITSQVGAAANAIALVFNTTTGKGEMWYDTDWSNVTAARVQLATFDNVTTLVGVQGFSSLDFVNFVV